MTEAGWAACSDPQLMLEHVGAGLGPRKAVLFGWACWRRLRHLLPEGAARAALEVAERHAEGVAGPEELEAARMAVQEVLATGASAHLGARAAEVLELLAEGLVPEARAAREASRAALRAAEWVGAWAVAAESKAQCDLLRDVLGNPFRPVAIDPVWRTSSVLAIAQAVYEERRFEDLPVLADALEEGGCTEADVLEHLRGPGPHTRGCHVLDAVLAKT